MVRPFLPARRNIRRCPGRPGTGFDRGGILPGMRSSGCKDWSPAPSLASTGCRSPRQSGSSLRSPARCRLPRDGRASASMPVMQRALALAFRPDTPRAAVRPMRAFPHSEVSSAIETMQPSRARPVVKLAFELVALTATRNGETRGTHWTAIDRNECARVNPVSAPGRTASGPVVAAGVGDPCPHRGRGRSLRMLPFAGRALWLCQDSGGRNGGEGQERWERGAARAPPVRACPPPHASSPDRPGGAPSRAEITARNSSP